MYKRKRIVIALGGNALGDTLPEQMKAVKTTAKAKMEPQIAFLELLIGKSPSSTI